jgi:hypothetical protein
VNSIVEGSKYWDGNQALDYLYNDGGRAEAGYTGKAGDCVCRSIAIAARVSYKALYKELSKINKKTCGISSARNGINTQSKEFKNFMTGIGFVWTPTMRIGSGCKVRLIRGELPSSGRLVVSLSRHYSSVIDGVINDTYDPTRTTINVTNEETRMSHRCVYGYWTFTPSFIRSRIYKKLEKQQDNVNA